ncbi:hypothetical protein EYR41_002241 [Orbilia oligospora]|uniref:Copper acquisition factor BIM1-like domain-containing protein n=1 Tax=Orbilia oligospora TaxID=2813651 RepID=A0A8H2DP52_ORBOL|nr:hypothetical protein EYR41_002241 [Orbilia oligospora]
MLSSHFFKLVGLASLTSAHFFLDTPIAIGFDDLTLTEAPCGGFDPTDRSAGVTEWPVLGYPIALITTHLNVNWTFRAALLSDVTNWVDIFPRIHQTGIAEFCLPEVPGIEAWIGQDAVVQIIQEAPDGLLHQCAAVKFVAGGPAVPDDTCDNDPMISWSAYPTSTTAPATTTASTTTSPTTTPNTTAASTTPTTTSISPTTTTPTTTPTDSRSDSTSHSSTTAATATSQGSSQTSSTTSGTTSSPSSDSTTTTTTTTPSTTHKSHTTHEPQPSHTPSTTTCVTETTHRTMPYSNTTPTAGETTHGSHHPNTTLIVSHGTSYYPTTPAEDSTTIISSTDVPPESSYHETTSGSRTVDPVVTTYPTPPPAYTGAANLGKEISLVAVLFALLLQAF